MGVEGCQGKGWDLSKGMPEGGLGLNNMMGVIILALMRRTLSKLHS